MKIILEAGLSEPPSSVQCFRDVTLYASCIIKFNVLVECQEHNRDIYYQWLRSHGAYDFIDEMILEDEEDGYKIGINKANLTVDRIDYNNLNLIISNLRKLKRSN